MSQYMVDQKRLGLLWALPETMPCRWIGLGVVLRGGGNYLSDWQVPRRPVEIEGEGLEGGREPMGRLRSICLGIWRDV
jgi:hypothetical protein